MVVEGLGQEGAVAANLLLKIEKFDAKGRSLSTKSDPAAVSSHAASASSLSTYHTAVSDSSDSSSTLRLLHVKSSYC